MADVASRYGEATSASAEGWRGGGIGRRRGWGHRQCGLPGHGRLPPTSVRGGGGAGAVPRSRGEGSALHPLHLHHHDELRDVPVVLRAGALLVVAVGRCGPISPTRGGSFSRILPFGTTRGSQFLRGDVARRVSALPRSFPFNISGFPS